MSQQGCASKHIVATKGTVAYTDVSRLLLGTLIRSVIPYVKRTSFRSQQPTFACGKMLLASASAVSCAGEQLAIRFAPVQLRGIDESDGPSG